MHTPFRFVRLVAAITLSSTLASLPAVGTGPPVMAGVAVGQPSEYAQWRAESSRSRTEPAASTVGALGAYDTEGLDLSDPLVQDAINYAEDQGVPLTAAVDRLSAQDVAGDLSAALEAGESETFGGLWIEHSPEFAIVASFTKGGEAAVRRYPEESGPLAGLLKVQQAKRSLVALRALQQRAIALTDDLGIQAEYGLDVPGGRVLVYAREDEGTQDALGDALASMPEDVVIVPVEALASPEANI